MQIKSSYKNRITWYNESMPEKKIKILLAEDEVDAVESIGNFLTRRGFEVLSTESGLKTVEIVKETKVDLILLDLVLDEISGVESLERIREFNQSVKIMIVTGSFLKKEDRQKICALGIHEFLSKPASSKELLDAIHTALNKDQCMQLSDLPEWQYDSSRFLENRHALKGMLGALNLQCSDFLSDIEVKDLDNNAKYKLILDQMKDVHEKIKKVCKKINDEIIA